jgi:hypothetical protein
LIRACDWMELQTSKIVVVAKSTYLFEAKGFDRLETWYVMASILRFKVYLNSFLSSLHLKSQYHKTITIKSSFNEQISTFDLCPFVRLGSNLQQYVRSIDV